LRLDLWRLRLFSIGGYGLALVVFGAYDNYPKKARLVFHQLFFYMEFSYATRCFKKQVSFPTQKKIIPVFGSSIPVLGEGKRH